MPIFLFLIFIFLFGLIIGSFLNCLIWRLHKKESMWNRSYCPKCGTQIAWYDNIPVLSFIFLGGRCRYCRKKISWQYPVVELTVGLLFVLAFYFNLKDLNPEVFNFKFLILNFQTIINYKFLIINLRDWLLIAVMMVVFIYDLRWYLILDEVTLPAAAILLVINLILGLSWFNILISALIGAGFFLAQFLVSRGRWVGGGDIRLGLLMGIGLGEPSLLIAALLLAYFSGSVIGVALILKKEKKWSSEIPFGVFLAPATIAALFWGREIVAWYWSR